MINSRLLRQFIAVAEELHYGRAAARAGIAQSPLSQAIQRLEALIGTPLFVRNKRSVALTPAGTVFLEEAYQWLRYEEVAIQRTLGASGGETGQLAIGFIGSVGYGFMPELINRFRQQFPQVRLRVVEMTTKDQLDQIQGRALDVGMLRTPLPTGAPHIQTRFYKRDALVVALPRSHPLAGRKRIDLRQLAGESFVAFSKEKVPAAHAQLISVCGAAGFYPNIEQECSQVASVICLVAAGLSVALVSGNLTSLIHPKVVYVPISNRTPYLDQEVAIAWRRNDANPALHSLLDVARTLETAAR
ncbi:MULTISPECIES: LysR family transcriptional regulator [unclassified Achromobacter]|uniref:LysR family transcriptional regulator n=1 Tax=unclassified Achromobacter TaxID=2626865 RepID=UPI000B515E43|nr:MULTISPECIES: LysR family transcriptional regulator [unclassified Achromobacter]OWT73642.1 LysR family transcriptional regulator [Achromobacter sp. HZ34]OWT79442.1 LysR family transcriptional regulator [Achromobacter sp. HZ28]